MQTEIQGGTGNKKSAAVNDHHQLSVDSATAMAIASARGDAYSWDSIEIDIDITDTMLFVRNDSDRPLILDRALVNGDGVVACIYDIGIGSDTTTPTGGAVVLGVNLNPNFAGKKPETTARSDETAVADATVVGRVKTVIDSGEEISLNGFILNKGQYIQFNQEVESSAGSIILYGYYD